MPVLCPSPAAGALCPPGVRPSPMPARSRLSPRTPCPHSGPLLPNAVWFCSWHRSPLPAGALNRALGWMCVRRGRVLVGLLFFLEEKRLAPCYRQCVLLSSPLPGDRSGCLYSVRPIGSGKSGRMSCRPAALSGQRPSPGLWYWFMLLRPISHPPVQRSTDCPVIRKPSGF